MYGAGPVINAAFAGFPTSVENSGISYDNPAPPGFVNWWLEIVLAAALINDGQITGIIIYLFVDS
jgi:hypothetical protein